LAQLLNVPPFCLRNLSAGKERGRKSNPATETSAEA